MRSIKRAIEEYNECIDMIKRQVNYQTDDPVRFAKDLAFIFKRRNGIEPNAIFKLLKLEKKL